MPKREVADRYQDLHFPAAGIDRSVAFGRQPNRPSGINGQYRRTCYAGNNVRSFDPLTNRSRGGQRTGLEKFLAAKVSGETWIVQDLASIVKIGAPVQLSQSGRVVTLVAVSQGRVFWVEAGGTAWGEATNNTGETPPLNITGVMFSSPNQQRLWFVDGVNAVVYTPITNVVDLWTATAGIFPVDSQNNYPRLVETWRGRTIVSGLLEDPQNIFMSAVDGPTDFDYAPLSPSALDAVALNIPNGLGLIGDVVNTIIPYTDDLLIIGCDSSIRVIRGDPLAGGQIDTVSRAIGMAWGRPWALDPYGNIYFMSNRCGIYTMVPGQQPQRISQGIESLLQDIDTGANAIRFLWNDRGQSLHVFVTPTLEPTTTTHFVYEQRTGAWFTDTFANNDHNPVTCCTFDGNSARDRVPLIGSWDGTVRSLSVDAADDDGTPIQSSVIIGPIVAKDMGEITVNDAVSVLASGSNDVYYDVLVGKNPEEALASTPVETGIWTADRNVSAFMGWSSHSLYFRLRSKPRSPNAWAIEQIRIRIRDRGRIRSRQQ